MVFANPLIDLAKMVLDASRRRQIKGFYYRTLFSSDLRKLALKFGTDKEGEHYYTQYYERHFAPLRKRKLKALEIGIGGYSYSRADGQSLRVWKAFFQTRKSTASTFMTSLTTMKNESRRSVAARSVRLFKHCFETDWYSRYRHR